MLRFLFPPLTAQAEDGVELFAWVTAQARAPHWYLAGQVEDSIDGRFAMLATIAALVSVRLERDRAEGLRARVALTERFIEAMEAEHREIGLGDPKLGRTVRKLVGSLARRVDIWRAAVGEGDWREASRQSVYGRAEPTSDALEHVVIGLGETWARLEAEATPAVAQGRIE